MSEKKDTAGLKRLLKSLKDSSVKIEGTIELIEGFLRNN